MSRMMTLPKIGVNMTEAVIDEWLVKQGDIISKGDVMLVAETDKATQEIFATDSGVIEKLIAQVGDTVACGENIMSLVDGESGQEEVAPKPVVAKAQTIAKEPEAQTAAKAPETIEKERKPIAAKEPETIVRELKAVVKTAVKGERVKISPLAKKTAKELGIDIAKLSPQLPGKRITKSDVMRFEKTQESAAVQEAPAVGGGSSFASMQIKANADNMTLLIGRLSKSGLDIGYVDIVAKASAVALSKYKGLFFGDDEINIGVQTGADSGAGVSVAVGADKKTVGQIKADIDAAALGSANFVVADFGAYDLESYAPTTGVLGCATLSVGVVAKKFVPDECDMPKLTSEIKMTLVFDELAADGIVAAAFLQKIKQYIENPELMLL